MRTEKHSIAAVGELKQITDTSDRFLIYKCNDSLLNGEQDYVFKSSFQMGHMGLNMDQNNEGKSPMQHEYCYFDGMHARCQNWKTFNTVGVSSRIKKAYELATMEVKKEDTSNCSLF